MSVNPDPFYNRKPVPDELINGVGYTGLAPADETQVRERKLSRTGLGDLRKFSNPKKEGKLDPFYQRKPVPDSLIQGVGDTGLTPEQEFLNRERKYSRNGDDIRKFSDASAKKGWKPSDDPYYGRKPVDKAQIVGVGELDLTPAEAYEVRERKASMFDLSGDPFQQVTGTGHRASVSAGPGLALATETQRRRSSAVAPHHNAQEHDEHHGHHHHSGYTGDDKLAPIESRPDVPPETTTGHANPTNTHTTTTTTTTTATHLDSNAGTANAGNVAGSDGIGHGTGESGHTTFYNAATRDLDNIAPHEQAH